MPRKLQVTRPLRTEDFQQLATCKFFLERGGAREVLVHQISAIKDIVTRNTITINQDKRDALKARCTSLIWQLGDLKSIDAITKIHEDMLAIKESTMVLRTSLEEAFSSLDLDLTSREAKYYDSVKTQIDAREIVLEITQNQSPDAQYQNRVLLAYGAYLQLQIQTNTLLCELTNSIKEMSEMRTLLRLVTECTMSESKIIKSLNRAIYTISCQRSLENRAQEISSIAFGSSGDAAKQNSSQEGAAPKISLLPAAAASIPQSRSSILQTMPANPGAATFARAAHSVALNTGNRRIREILSTSGPQKRTVPETTYTPPSLPPAMAAVPPTYLVLAPPAESTLRYSSSSILRTMPAGPDGASFAGAAERVAKIAGDTPMQEILSLEKGSHAHSGEQQPLHKRQLADIADTPPALPLSAAAAGALPILALPPANSLSRQSSSFMPQKNEPPQLSDQELNDRILQEALKLLFPDDRAAISIA